MSQKVLTTIRNPVDGNHDVSAVNEAIADGKMHVTQMISDCQSVIIYLLESKEESSES